MNTLREKDTPEKIRAYLLGDLEVRETEREEIEDRIIFEEDYLQMVLFQEEELIRDYADGNLSEEEKEKFETYFLVPVERRRKVKLELMLRKHVGGQKVSEIIEPLPEPLPAPPPEPVKGQGAWKMFGGFRSPVPVFAVLMLMVGVAAVVIWNGYFRVSERERALISLNKAYAAERPFDSRITGFDYAPYEKTREPDESRVNSVDEKQAERISLDEIERDPSAENQHLLARVYLAKKDFDQALKLLEEARKKAPQNNEILNDIGAAYLEKSNLASRGDEKLTMVASALENFDKALAIKPDSLPARFNRALAVEIYLPNRAKEAWEEYLKFDNKSDWAEDAKKHLQALDKEKSRNISSSVDVENAFEAAYKDQNDERAFQIVSQNRELISGKYLPQKLAMTLVIKKKMKESGNSNS